ncbi:MAG: hypothetical protein ABIB43_02185 [archaeon]
MDLDFFGIDVQSTGYRKIKGLESERCVVYQRLEDYSMGFSEELQQEMLDNGITEEELAQAIEEQNIASQEMIGKYSTCKYPISDLITMLEKEQEGSFSASTEDEEKYQCTGTMYKIVYS